jgi:hypothetical protein
MGLSILMTTCSTLGAIVMTPLLTKVSGSYRWSCVLAGKQPIVKGAGRQQNVNEAGRQQPVSDATVHNASATMQTASRINV